jgi:DNA-binding MarR family transcriptional regulator
VRRADRPAAREHGLRVAEYEVLANCTARRLTQQELARRCFVAKSGISMLVSRMEDAARCGASRTRSMHASGGSC